MGGIAANLANPAMLFTYPGRRNGNG